LAILDAHTLYFYSTQSNTSLADGQLESFLRAAVRKEHKGRARHPMRRAGRDDGLINE
jgi:hypothetical protein